MRSSNINIDSLSAAKLLSDATNVRQAYVNKKGTQGKRENPARVRLISILEEMAQGCSVLDRTATLLSEKDFKDLCLSIWLFCSTSIEMNKGRLEGLGSLHEILGQQLGEAHLETINIFNKLHYLSKLYHFMKKNKGLFDLHLSLVHTTEHAFCDELLDVMRQLFQCAQVTVNTSLKALPNEEALDEGMRALPARYKQWVEDKAKKAYIQTAHDPHHKFLAALIAAISQLIKPDTVADSKQFLTRSEREKLGVLFHSMRFVYNQYRWTSQHNAGMYHLPYEILNQNEIDSDIAVTTQINCISAFLNLLDAENIRKLETIMRDQYGFDYIDSDIVKVKKEAQIILDQLSKQSAIYPSAVTLTAAAVGGILAAEPGYGVGYTIGHLTSAMNSTLATKIQVSQITGKVMTGIFGNSGQCLGYFVSNLVVDIALERSFAKVFELLAILLGAGTGAAVSIVVYDLSYQTLRSLYRAYFTLQAQIHPNLARNIDTTISDCLLDLPDEIFQANDKTRLKLITHTETVSKTGLFSKESATVQVEEDALSAAPTDTGAPELQISIVKQ